MNSDFGLLKCQAFIFLSFPQHLNTVVAAYSNLHFVVRAITLVATIHWSLQEHRLYKNAMVQFYKNLFYPTKYYYSGPNWQILSLL